MLETHCLCTKLRRVSRLVTGLYDHELAVVGLKVTQFSLLRTILRLGESGSGDTSITNIAKASGHDRSTLGRNLRVMEKSGWIKFGASGDMREKSIIVTQKGKRIIAKAIPLWERAQTKMDAISMGKEIDLLCRQIEEFRDI